MNHIRTQAFFLKKAFSFSNFSRRSLNSFSVDNVRSRFFTKKYQIEINNKISQDDSSKSDINNIIFSIENFISTSSHNLPNTESAIVYVPSLSLTLPLISMKIQSQHLLFDKDLKQLESSRFVLENDKYHFSSKIQGDNPMKDQELIQDEIFITKNNKIFLDFYILFFSPRATISNSILNSQLEEDEDDDDENDSTNSSSITCSSVSPSRTYSLERHQILDEELKNINIDPSLLQENKDFLGTPMVKIYKSFIYPKKNKNIIYNIKQAANRTAFQISLAFRQYYTDLNSTFIRNTDKSKYLQEVQTFPVILVLDNIRSAFNVGSMFRTAETSGVEEIITCGITPHPPHPKLKKTALNSTDNVPTRHFDDIIAALDTLKKEGYTIISLETTKESVKYTTIQYPKKVAIVVGNEITGVDQRALNLSDKIAEIPTFGLKNSLNVASCAPIVLYEIIRQWDQ